jgi:hypothetical protein
LPPPARALGAWRARLSAFCSALWQGAPAAGLAGVRVLVSMRLDPRLVVRCGPPRAAPYAWMRSSLPTPARLLRRTSCSGPRLRSPLLSVGIRASPSSTDQTPQARAPAWCARRRRSPDRGTRRRVSCLTPALPRRADRREGASCFGRNPSYDVPNNRDVACLLRSNSRARDHSAATALASNARASREPGRTVAPRPRRPCAALWRRRSHPGGKQAPADAPVPLRDCSVVDAGACCAPGRRRLAAACGRCSTTSVSQAARL